MTAAAGTAVVVAGAATVWAFMANTDDGHPLPRPAPGSAVSYSLAIPADSTGAGGQFPLDGARIALTADGGAVLSIGTPARGFHLLSSGTLSEIVATGLNSFRPVATASGPVLLGVSDAGVAAFDPKVGAVTTIPVAANLAGFPAIGELADGTVLVVDAPQETVWALTGNGTAKQLLKFPVSGLNQRCADAADGQECADHLLQDTVVDSHGTVYALEHYTGSDRNELEADHYAPLSTLLTADSTAGGASARITLPRSIPSVPGDPAALRTLAIAPADNGVYALVETPDGDFTSARYVLHIHAGTADVVAAQRTLPGGGAAVRCSFQGSASPTALPCLPNHAASLAFGDGRLLVAGWLDAPDNAPASQTANVVIGLGAA
jgi:hypothetical protein